MARPTYDPLAHQAEAERKLAAERKAALAREQLAADTRWLMSHAAGRRLMWRWLAICHIDHTTFTGDSKGMFKEGERNVGLQLKAQVGEHAFDDYILMLREHQPPAK